MNEETFVKSLPVVGAADLALIAAAIEPMKGLIAQARLGSSNLARVQLDETLRWAPLLMELQKEPAFQTILFKGPKSMYNLRSVAAAAIRVLEDHREAPEKAGEMLTALLDKFKATAAMIKKGTTLISVDKALLTIDLPGLNVISMQDFSKLQEEPGADGTGGSNITQYWYRCIARALQVNQQRDEGEEEFVFTQSSYEDGKKASKMMTKIGRKWQDKPDDALADFTEARTLYLSSPLIPSKATVSNLVFTPVFKAYPITVGV
jgi:hypothetical protein